MTDDPCDCNICQMIAQTTWISVKDRLPEDGDRVLVSQGDVEIAYYSHELGWQTLDSDWHQIYGVTHWMPLPKPPEE